MNYVLYNNKKGFIRTLEGALSLFVLLTFLFYVIPHVPVEDNVGGSARNFVALAIENLDKSGVLDDYILGNTSNLSAVESALNMTVPSSLSYTVGVSKANASSGTVFSEESYVGVNISYTVNNSYFKDAYVVVNFINAVNPRVYGNGEEIFSYGGVHPGGPVRLDVTSSIVEGVNNVEIKTLNNATVDYVLIVDNEEILSYVPKDRAIGVVTYILSGKEEWFQPTIVEVFLWK